MIHPSRKFSSRSIFALIGSVILLLVFAFYYTNNPKEPTQAIRPPVPDADIPFDEYVLHPDSLLLIERATGTRLAIYPHSLARKDGKPVQGDIVVKVREFHSATEILRAGIPMNVGNGYLESAGMLEIRAFNNDEEMRIRDGQYIEVSLASYRPSEGYQLYSLQEDRNWIVKDSFFIMNNENKRVRLKQLDSLASLQPDKDTTGDFFFELVMDTAEAPELIPFWGQQWRITDPGQRESVEKALRIHWDDVKVVEVDRRNLIYELNFSLTRYKEHSKGPDRTFRILATPIVSGKNDRQRRRNFNKQMELYAAGLEKVKEERRRWEVQADLLNTFKLQQLGLCNIDRVLNMGEYVTRKVKFDFEESIDPNFGKQNLYVLLEENNSYICYPRAEWDKVVIPKLKRVKMMVVISKEEIAIIDTAGIQSKILGTGDVLSLNTRRVDAAAYLKSLGTVPSVP